MPDAKQVMVAEFKRKKVAEIIHNADVIFCLDFNTLSRIGFIGEWIERSSAVKILIDHHQMPEKFDYVYSDTTIRQPARMVFISLEALGLDKKIAEDSAKCLYTGIMTDTGGFRFRKRGRPGTDYLRYMDTNTISRLHLLSLILRQNRSYKEWAGCNYVAETQRKWDRFGFEKGLAEGFVNYGTKYIDVKMSVFFMEDIQKILLKISSVQGHLDVNLFSRNYFNGGGHINAADKGKFIQELTAKYQCVGEHIVLGKGIFNGEVVPEVNVCIPLSTVNRHGLIAGATGTGKTKDPSGFRRAAFTATEFSSMVMI
ncbi:hypothetical protein FQR65_LT16292 [Abscondita terminalis]|nr:hypothetical protein FQR65_LT16292 [Abscondita terminalis]